MELAYHGLTSNTTHKWKVYGSETVLYTNAFDVDDYYASTVYGVDAFNPPRHIIPAYAVTDIENLLPPYLLTRDDRKRYEISLDNIYGLRSQKACRLADAFALMLLQCFKNKIILPETANNLFATSADG
jgi:hypothetical protein